MTKMHREEVAPGLGLYQDSDDDGPILRLYAGEHSATVAFDPRAGSRRVDVELSRDEIYALAKTCSMAVYDDCQRPGFDEAARAKALKCSEDLGLLRVGAAVVAS